MLEDDMQHDLQLRAAARAIYENVYPTQDWTPVAFEEAERFGTVHYRQAVGAAQEARSVLITRHQQLLLAAIL
jgi:hypothetical protein